MLNKRNVPSGAQPKLSAQSFQYHENERKLSEQITKESKPCLALWAEYLRRAVLHEYEVDPSIKNSEFFDELCELLGFSRLTFDNALKRNDTQINKTCREHRRRLAKYGTSSSRTHEEDAEKHRFSYVKKHPYIQNSERKSA